VQLDLRSDRQRSRDRQAARVRRAEAAALFGLRVRDGRVDRGLRLLSEAPSVAARSYQEGGVDGPHPLALTA
jgi:hypothetical protein